ncbi:hypothetical protein HU200_042872 [Digitaria exilis]|uniref:Uncharacterized protein n=1 Tax=Digitaria exilis TaxID=1010633 RepID=A0A835B3T3_9POAL|nr:hypothetical protein HU200_042872 [Digitaria exilis]
MAAAAAAATACRRAAVSSYRLLGPPPEFFHVAAARTATATVGNNADAPPDKYKHLVDATFYTPPPPPPDTTISPPPDTTTSPPATKTRTENNSPTFSSSGDPCLDFFFHVVPDTPASSVASRLAAAWAAEPLTALRLACNLRGVRGTGKSDREGFYAAALWIHGHHPSTLALNARAVAQFGYLKDLPEILHRIIHGGVPTTGPRRLTASSTSSSSSSHVSDSDIDQWSEVDSDDDDESQAKESDGDGEGTKAEEEGGAAAGEEEEEQKRKAEEVSMERQRRRAVAAVRALHRYSHDENYRFLYDSTAEVFAELLADDMKKLADGKLNELSLAAKWCPSIDCSYDRSTLLCEAIAGRLFPKGSSPELPVDLKDRYYAYRVRELLRKEALTPLRAALKLPEVFISNRAWASVVYTRVASVAMQNYRELFLEHDKERFEKYLEDVKAGKAKIAAGALLPHQIIASIDDEGLADLQWERMISDLKELGKLSNCMAICDVSGSMHGEPMDVSVALGLLISELSDEPWRHRLITFSRRPELHLIRGETLMEKTDIIRRMQWNLNTDFQAVFDKLLGVAVEGKLPPEKMVRKLFVFSDMEFDQASSKPWETDYEAITRKFTEAGYGEAIPEIVFWNLRDSKSVPVTAGEKGVALVSGFSKNLVKLFLDNGGIVSPRPRETTTSVPRFPVYVFEIPTPLARSSITQNSDLSVIPRATSGLRHDRRLPPRGIAAYHLKTLCLASRGLPSAGGCSTRAAIHPGEPAALPTIRPDAMVNAALSDPPIQSHPLNDCGFQRWAALLPAICPDADPPVQSSIRNHRPPINRGYVSSHLYYMWECSLSGHRLTTPSATGAPPPCSHPSLAPRSQQLQQQVNNRAMAGLLLYCLVTCIHVLAGNVAGARPPAMFVFGSSIVDVGNNNYLLGTGVPRANRPFNGIDFPGSIPTGRFSNGYNTADYIAKNMGFACSPPAYLSLAPTSPYGPLVPTALTNGVNYASGGAGILDPTNAGNNIPLSKQVQYFKATKAKMVAAAGPVAVNAVLSRSVFLLNAGNNDMYVFAAAELARNSDAAALYASLVSNYFAAITELYSMGARRFAIINAWLLGCVPAVRVLSPTGACSGLLNQLAGGFNDALRSLLAGDDLAQRLPGLVYSLADFFGFTQDTLTDPRASGFTDIAGACCGSGRLGGEAECFPNSTLCVDRDRHVFWDLAHPSQRAAFLAARAFYDGPAQYTTPINFMQLAQSSY